jgi:hypothetical protein
MRTLCLWKSSTDLLDKSKCGAPARNPERILLDKKNELPVVSADAG